MDLGSINLKINQTEPESYPFAHFLIRNFLDSNFLFGLQSELKEIEDNEKPRIYKSEFGDKKEYKYFPSSYIHVNEFLSYLSSDGFLKVISGKLGLNSDIEIFPDLTYDGGGYVISPPGSFLGYHADFNFSSNVNMYRVINVLFYLNTNYDSSSGGHLHLLDAVSKTVEGVVYPQENTFLAFLTDDISYHGVSRNLNYQRRSFNLYFYSPKPISNHQTLTPHKTLWISSENDKHDH